MSDASDAGFKQVTEIAQARERLLGRSMPHGRTERVPLVAAGGRLLASDLTADRDVPHFTRAAVDGWAVQAADTFGAGERSPAVLGVADQRVSTGRAVRVHTGSELPDGADAVVMIEDTTTVGEEIEVFDAAAGGQHVAPAGEDVATGQALYERGHRIRPSDLGLLKSVGIRRPLVADRPTVGVIPTGEELVDQEPAPGEVIETNGLTVSRYVERWGGQSTYRDVVTDDSAALRAAIQRDLVRDVIVTTGGSSVGARDLIPDVVEELGELLVHGVALKPGHPCALGVVEETPVVILPGYPVACIINAVQFLRPLIYHLAGGAAPPHPAQQARLDRKVLSEPGVRTFARVRLASEEGELVATPTRASGSGVLSSVALADGWVAVPEPLEGYDTGETVSVQNWESHQ